jgi:NADPH:quinone reductase-like Zn-dependent oxidoreductase
LVNLGLGKSIGPGAYIVDVPKPNISDQEILIKVYVVGLNPTDFKHIDFMAPSNRIIGRDYAGEVVEVDKAALGG